MRFEHLNGVSPESRARTPGASADRRLPDLSLLRPRIELVCFNGATAAALYQRLVMPTLNESARAVRTVILPSTSPAHAGMPYAQKLARWAALIASR